jgi:hypothetical protein
LLNYIYIYKKKNISIHALKPKHASLLQATLQTIDTTRDKKKIENGVETAKQKKERKKNRGSRVPWDLSALSSSIADYRGMGK